MTYGDTATRVLLSVLAQDRPTVRSVAAEVGKSVVATHAQLCKLRAAGLVEYGDGKQGHLRAMVTVVPARIDYDGGHITEWDRRCANSPVPGRPVGGRRDER